ncbi:MAG: hypothetical protein JXR48_06065 [Candidatus Delongbacteria bacterium]|nr:hypothetical protein [Candidatus Delongbacteria bacterium]MBN2834516.1 hypothetical protein [Candidatus Delongbacteria bacterium]
MIKLLVVLSIMLAGDYDIKLPEMENVKLEAYSKISDKKIDESSGLAKSRQFDNVYWTLNDSGDKARIFAIDINGKLIAPQWDDDYKGLMISDAVNIDWEDITADNNGFLYIAACGNNGNARKDLSIYMLKEPNPLGVNATRYFKKIDFFYPEQDGFPPVKRNFDCEAIFHNGKNLYLLTKHRSDFNTVLYRFDSMESNGQTPVTKISEFPIGGNVTAADCSIDGKRLAVLTYQNVWVFESEDGNYFNGKKYFLPISADQCEAITFENNNELIITNEQTEMFKIKISEMKIIE